VQRRRRCGRSARARASMSARQVAGPSNSAPEASGRGRPACAPWSKTRPAPRARCGRPRCCPCRRRWAGRPRCRGRADGPQRHDDHADQRERGGDHREAERAVEAERVEQEHQRAEQHQRVGDQRAGPPGPRPRRVAALAAKRGQHLGDERAPAPVAAQERGRGGRDHDGQEAQAAADRPQRVGRHRIGRRRGREQRREPQEAEGADPADDPPALARMWCRGSRSGRQDTHDITAMLY
jgi:hypothetical protein